MYWIATRRLRRGQAVCARSHSHAPGARYPRDLSWDPDYKPQDGDSVILASKNPTKRRVLRRSWSCRKAEAGPTGVRSVMRILSRSLPGQGRS